MMMHLLRRPWITCLLAALAGWTALTDGTGRAIAQQPTEAAVVAEDPSHEQLRQLRRDLENVVGEADWEKIRPFVSADVVVTWLDGTQSHGVEEVIAYLESKTGGESPLVEKYSLQTEVAELSDLYGDDVALAYGMANSTFVLRGVEVSLAGPWSATMVREDDGWKLAALSASVGAFDNPLLTWYRRLIWIVGIVAALLGLLLGFFLAGGRRSRRAATVASTDDRLGEDRI